LVSRFAHIDKNESVEGSYLTVAEVAELLKLNQQTVRNWIDRGELEAVRVGARRVRIRQKDLDRFLTTGTRTIADGVKDQPGAVAVEDPVTELWARFGKQMSEVHGSIADEDPAELAAALRSLGDAANSLAAALGASSESAGPSDPHRA
jgi:excisionase family DNA binding protein